MHLCAPSQPTLPSPLHTQHNHQGVPNNYETDLIFPIVSKAAELAGVDYHSAGASAQTALKVIGDHTRAVVYLISDGVLPSNVGRGYVVRRLLRRVVMKVKGGWGVGCFGGAANLGWGKVRTCYVQSNPVLWCGCHGCWSASTAELHRVCWPLRGVLKLMWLAVCLAHIYACRVGCWASRASSPRRWHRWPSTCQEHVTHRCVCGGGG